MLMRGLTPDALTVPLADATHAVTPLARIYIFESADWMLPAAIVVLVVCGILWLIGKSRTSREQQDRADLTAEVDSAPGVVSDSTPVAVPDSTPESISVPIQVPVAEDPRDASWAELFNAETSAARLAQIAAEHPEFAAQIGAHPNVYPELQRWIADRIAEQADAPMSTDFAASGPEAAVPGAASSEAAAPSESTLSVHRRSEATRHSIVISTVALSLTAGGIALGLALVNSLAPAPGDASASSTAHTETVTFRDGLAEAWTVRGDELADAESNSLGHLPRMNAIHVPRTEQPLQIDGGVIVQTFPPGLDSQLSLLDPNTGEVVWNETGAVACRPDEGFSIALCSISDGTSTDVVTLDHRGELDRFTVSGDLQNLALQGDNILLAGGGSLLLIDRSGEIQWHVESSFGLLQTTDSLILSYSAQGWELFDRTGNFLGQGHTEQQSGAFDSCEFMLTEQKLLMAGTLCSALAPFDGIDFEIIDGVDALSPRFVSSDQPTWFYTDHGTLHAVDGITGEPRWSIEGGLLGTGQEVQIVETTDGSAVLLAGSDAIQLVSLASGEVLGTQPTAPGDQAVVLPDAIVQFEPKAGLMRTFDLGTLEELEVHPWAPPSNYGEVIGGVNGALAASLHCVDCTVADGSHVIDGYTFYGPATDDELQATPAGSSKIPECPADTKLLAWAEFTDGWMLVCGVELSRPSYVALQTQGSSTPLLSRGSTRPLSKEAASAVIWDAELGRYTAEMQDGSVLILDHAIGTATLRDASGQTTAAQHRFVRYHFVMLGNGPLTAADAARGSGAYGVQAPEETAEDQVRYLVEVLERAYEGRALVKEALPKLEKCSAGPGGYTDTIAEMKQVRDNRAELLSALDAAPVDLVPEGTQLVDDLRAAISLSHEANVHYVAWAEEANRSGCAQLSPEGRQYADASDAPKERFAARWNSVVAPTFGVRTFDPWYI